MELVQADILAHKLLSRHQLQDWSFGFNKNKRRLGVCKQSQKRIELSSYYVEHNSADHVTDTILHEIAHALVGAAHGHDQVWKQMCRQIGCQPKACDSSATMPEGNWLAVCPTCCNRFSQHRRPRRLKGLYCLACGPKNGSLRFIPQSTPNQATQPAWSPRQLKLSFAFPFVRLMAP